MDQNELSIVDAASVMNLSGILSIRDTAPLEIAMPIYGYVLPVVVIITVVTNSFIVLVLSQPQLRTPTNCILLAMAVMELLTGLASFPWMLYYYTFGGYVRDSLIGMPEFWCRTSPYFAEIFPTVFHTSAIWLTVYLAIQRYWFVCTASHRRSLVSTSAMSLTRCKISVVLICTAAVLVELPMIFGKFTSPFFTGQYTFCLIKISEWVLKLGPNYFFSAYYWFLVIFVHAGPCSLLVIFGSLLIQTVRAAMKHRRESLGYLLKERDRANSCSGGTSSSLHATTKMLVVVIVIFLITEIPAAVIFTLHVLSNTFSILPIDSYHSMNAALIFRNVFIMISYPFNFAVYLSMSYQFRATVRRLFCRQINRSGTITNSRAQTDNRHNQASTDKGTQITASKRSAPVLASASAAKISDRRFSLADNRPAPSIIHKRKSIPLNSNGNGLLLSQMRSPKNGVPSDGCFISATCNGEVKTVSSNGDCSDHAKRKVEFTNGLDELL